MIELEVIKANLKLCMKSLTTTLNKKNMQVKLDYNNSMDSLTIKEIKENII